jgi:hypothetical protein
VFVPHPREQIQFAVRQQANPLFSVADPELIAQRVEQGGEIRPESWIDDSFIGLRRAAVAGEQELTMQQPAGGFADIGHRSLSEAGFDVQQLFQHRAHSGCFPVSER